MTVSLFPDSASTIAPKVDLLFYVLTAMSLFFFVAVVAVLIFFSIKYRKGSSADRTMGHGGHDQLEIIWTVIPTILALAIFVWATMIYFDITKVPKNALEILVTGKQWMWKIQQPNGKREINQLHVPLGVPVQLTMTSEDVIHSFFIPAFRLKKDVLPGRYTNMWFQATKAGEYHLFCAEYCGTDHSRMVGQVIVMEPRDYEKWLGGEISIASTSKSSSGEKLFARLGCVQCHEGSSPRGPALAGVFGSDVKLQSGEVVKVDEAYIRESILTPQAKLVAGYPPLMPTFQNQVKEEDIFTLIDYIKSMKNEQKNGSKS